MFPFVTFCSPFIKFSCKVQLPQLVVSLLTDHPGCRRCKMRPFDVTLAIMLRMHLNPGPSDPRPGEPLFRCLEDGLLAEIRSLSTCRSSDLFNLLQRIQVSRHAAPPHTPAAPRRPSAKGAESYWDCSLLLQEGLTPQGVAGEEYFEEVKQGLGTHLLALEVPDDLLNVFDAVRDLVNSCTIDDRDSNEPGADANSTLGLFLRRLFVSHAAMSFEVGL